MTFGLKNFHTYMRIFQGRVMAVWVDVYTDSILFSLYRDMILHNITYSATVKERYHSIAEIKCDNSHVMVKLLGISWGKWPRHNDVIKWKHFIMTSSNGNIFRVTGPLWGGFVCHRWISLTKASDAEFDVLFDLRLNKRLSKPSRRRWFDTASR